MSSGDDLVHRQLYTKRTFVQVGDGNRIVRFRDSSETRRSERRQRLIRLIPLLDGSPTGDGVISDLQLRTVEEDGRRLNYRPKTNSFNVASEHQQHPIFNDSTSDCRTNIERLAQEKSRLQQELRYVYKANDILETGTSAQERDQNNLASDILSTIKDDLRVLLSGQQNIDSRLDSLQKEQLKNKHELEADLARIKEELKSGSAEKPVDISDLSEVRQKQANLYDEFNLLFLRLDEMEQLVANLLRDTKEEVYVRTQDQPGKIEEVRKSESLQSVLSISSGSSVEEPSSQLKKSRKPSQAYVISQSQEEPQVGIGKPQTTDITRF